MGGGCTIAHKVALILILWVASEAYWEVQCTALLMQQNNVIATLTQGNLYF